MLPKKLKQKAQEYVEFRNNNHDKDFPEGWGEEYKWEILPKVQEEFLESEFAEDNVLEKAKIIRKNNPSSGSFCSWRLTSNLVQLAEEKPSLLLEVFEKLFNEEKKLSERIDTVHEMIRDYDKDLTQGTPSFAYILAANDYEKYPIYKDSTLQDFKKEYGDDFDIDYSSIGEKYENFVNLCRKFGNHISNNLDLETINIDGQKVSPGYTALDGQDFLYYLENYDQKNNNETEKDFYLICKNEQGHSDLVENGELEIKTRNKEGNKRQIYSDIKDAQPGDHVYVYIVQPSGKIKAVAEIIEGVHDNNNGQEVITLQLKKNISDPVKLDEIQHNLSFDNLQSKNFLKLSDNDVKIIKNKMENNISQDLDFTGFTEQTFNYLEEIHDDNSYERLKEISDEVHKYAIHPLRDLLEDIGDDFDKRNILKLEKEKYLTSSLYKPNPKLGGYSYIWGALYQKNKKRINSMQFYVGIDKEILAYGVYNSSNEGVREQIVENIENYGDSLKEYIPQDIFKSYNFDDAEKPSTLNKRYNPNNLNDLLDLLKEHDLNIRKIADSNEVIEQGQNLVSEVKEVFEELIPLYVLGITDSPIELLEKYYQKDKPTVETTEKITKQDLLGDLFLNEKDLGEILELLNGSDKQQIILQGPPGTGKTYIAREVAKYLAQTEANINTIQFHPSYSYEDFMEGYRPTSDGDFSLEDGVFKKLCDEARSRPDEKFVMIIDEINRGNLSKVFGELMYLLEYRGEEVQLTYSKKSFSIPENVYLIGTMNTADRSLAIMDYALRRRFYFVDQPPRLDQLEHWLDSNAKLNAEQVVGDIQKMNEKIESFMGSKDYNVGHSYFMKKGLDKEKLEQVLNYEVRPLLQEYFFDNPGKVDGIVGIFE